MLNEDIHIGLMPSTRNKAYQIEVTPDSQLTQEVICFGLPNDYGEQNNVIDAIEHFINYVGKIIGYYGEANFEIIYFYGNEDQLPQRFKLEYIPKETIYRRGKSLIQKGYQLEPRSHTKSKFKVKIPNEFVTTFSMPRILGGAKEYVRIIKMLSELSAVSIMPKFVQSERENFLGPHYFNLSRYNSLLKAEVYNITRKLGWPAREYRDNLTTEYFSIHRYLKFELTKALLRQEIILSLNKTLERISTVITPKIQIAINGLPTSTEIATIINELSKGIIGFSEAIDKVKL